jgi:hypothetical protein
MPQLAANRHDGRSEPDKHKLILGWHLRLRLAIAGAGIEIIFTKLLGLARSVHQGEMMNHQLQQSSRWGSRASSNQDSFFTQGLL